MIVSSEKMHAAASGNGVLWVGLVRVFGGDKKVGLTD